jgi:hypothetical protein
MLTSLQRLPWLTVQSCSVTSCRRSIAFSIARQADSENFPSAEPVGLEVGPSGSNSAEMLDSFLQTVGAKYKTPRKPNNWLGGDKVCSIFYALLSGHSYVRLISAVSSESDIQASNAYLRRIA